MRQAPYAPNRVSGTNVGTSVHPSSPATSVKIVSAEGGQPGMKTSTGTTSCTGRTRLSSARHDDRSGSAGWSSVFQVGAAQDRLRTPKRLRMPGTLEVTAQSPSDDQDLRARANMPDLVQVFLAGDGAFDQRDVDAARETP